MQRKRGLWLFPLLASLAAMGCDRNPSAENARVFIILMLTYIIGIGGLSHVIAGSVETLYAVTTGVTSWTTKVWRRRPWPTTAGTSKNS